MRKHGRDSALQEILAVLIKNCIPKLTKILIERFYGYLNGENIPENWRRHYNTYQQKKSTKRTARITKVLL